MKKLVWSETRVEGGRRFTGALTKPPTTTGPFQNVPLMDVIAMMTGQQPKAPPEFYKDTAVIAYRVPAADVPMRDLHPTVSSSAGNIDASLLDDGDLVKFSALPMAPVGQQAWIQFAFSKPVAIRGVSLSIAGLKWPFGPPPAGPDLEASDDGRTFRKIANIPAQHGRAEHGLVSSGRSPVLQGGIRDAAAATCHSTSTSRFRRHRPSTRSRSSCCTPARA